MMMGEKSTRAIKKQRFPPFSFQKASSLIFSPFSHIFYNPPPGSSPHIPKTPIPTIPHSTTFLLYPSPLLSPPPASGVLKPFSDPKLKNKKAPTRDECEE